ncbi:DUF309 domain-containing protein [Candidatus Bathyarchaeota archaeon]|nr:DUF309 domain-containing protein [Candidatus Bathyarchaeota archaeon]
MSESGYLESEGSPRIWRGPSAARHLVRVSDGSKHSPQEVLHFSNQIREILGSKESASHFRVASEAVEFNMFASSGDELDRLTKLLENRGFNVLSTKLLDTPQEEMPEDEAVNVGVLLFNEERFWECHEILEQTWRVSRGSVRDALQSMILTAAAFVHYQKNEPEICLSVLKRAKAKMVSNPSLEELGLGELRSKLDAILESGRVRPFKLRTGRARAARSSKRVATA